MGAVCALRKVSDGVKRRRNKCETAGRDRESLARKANILLVNLIRLLIVTVTML